MDSLRWDFTSTAGGAASTTTVPLNGNLYGFALILGTAAAVDLTIANAEAVTLYTKATLNASAMHLCRKQDEDSAGTAITSYEPQPVVGPLTLTIANGGATKTASIILYLG